MKMTFFLISDFLESKSSSRPFGLLRRKLTVEGWKNDQNMTPPFDI